MVNKEKSDILVVDDKPGNLLAMEAVLESHDRNIITATSGNQALGLMLEHEFALVILDIQMPEMNGIETAKIIRESKKIRETPIIFVTAINKDEQHVFEGYSTGAVDYIFKPVNPVVLNAKINVLLQMHRQKMTIKQTNRQLKKMVKELETANRRILVRHKSQIEEERLKIIMQLAGASACEMNQPLMDLLNNIEQLQSKTWTPDRQAVFLEEIKKSGEKIFTIARHIQSMQATGLDESGMAVTGSNLNQPFNVLVLCADRQDYDQLTDYLKNTPTMPAALFWADTVKKASDMLLDEKIDLVITDYHLPSGTGFDMMDFLKEKNMNLPVIFIASNGGEAVAARAIKNGAYDYLSRNDLNKELLHQALAGAIEKDRLQKEIAAAYKRLAVLSTRDSLTQLYNRRYFNEVIENEITKVKRYGSEMSLCMVDLDNFKNINDRFGHLAGDKVLSTTAGILNDLVRECDVVCRYGGEEFGLILPKTYTRDAFSLGERIRKSIEAHKYEHEKNDIGVTVSIGIASSSQNSNLSLSSLINQADNALYAAKAKGRNRVEIFSH